MEPQPLTPAAIHSLTRVGIMHDKQVRLEIEIREEVAQARMHGSTWRMIGVALGTSTQAAWDKYSGHQRDSEIPEQQQLPTEMFGEGDYPGKLPAPKHAAGFGKHTTVEDYEECQTCGEWSRSRKSVPPAT